MSEQSDALNRVAREKGIQLDGGQSSERGNRDGLPPLPWILLPRAGEQALTFAEEVGFIVGANGLYRRDAVPVTIEKETGRVEEMDSQRFRTYVESQLVPYLRLETQYGTMKVRGTISNDEARCCLRSDNFRYPLRKLQRVNNVRLPAMRRDGRIELLPTGYDAESAIFTMKDALEYDLTWTLDQARFFLDDLIKEFPIADERSKAAHIVAMLAIFGAALMPAGSKRLNFLYRANVPRSGKGLLAATAIAGPCGFVMVQSIPSANDEFRKILDTESLNGSPYIFFDEVERRLVNRTLNAFMTSTVWTGRLMNSQQKFAVPQTAIVFMTGNNVELSSDLAGRVLLIDLYAAEADPQARQITRVIDESYLAKPYVRADLLAALWALVRAWDKAGRPQPSSAFRGFELFGNIFGGIVEHAGYGNALESTIGEVDPDYSDMLAVVGHLAEGVSSRAEYEFPKVIDVCREVNAFEWWLQGKHVKAAPGGENDAPRFELTPTAKTFFGKLFSLQYGGTIFRLADGRRVRWSKRGRNRQRRYTIEIIGRGESTAG